MSTAVPALLRGQVVERAKGCCAYCRSTEQLMGVTFEIDHIVPRAVGGETVQALNLNRPKLVQTRHYWIALGLHPPTD